MIYCLQIILISIFIVVERYYTKWARNKLANNEPYRSGYFMLHELTGSKAAFMYKTNIIILRIVILLTVISILIIDFID